MDELTLKVDGRAVSPVVRERYLDWLSLPESARIPPLEKDWCTQNRVHPSTCWRWRRSEGVRREVAERVKARVLPRLPNVIEALLCKAEQGDVKAIELTLRHIAEVWHFAGDDQDDGDRPDLAQRLVHAITGSDLGRVLSAQLQAHERARQQAQAVDAEVQDVTEEGVEPKG